MYKGYFVARRLPSAVSIKKKKSAATTAAPARLWPVHASAMYAGLAICPCYCRCLRILATVKQTKVKEWPSKVRVWTHSVHYIIAGERALRRAPVHLWQLAVASCGRRWAGEPVPPNLQRLQPNDA